MVICLEQGAALHMAQLMPLSLAVSCFSKIQIGFAFLVLDHPGSHGQQQQPFNGRLSGTTQVGRYQKKHSPAHTHRGQRTSFITFLHLQWSTASSLFSLRADSPLEQPLSRSSLVFPWVLKHQLYSPCISSPNHHHLFAAHAHTNAACSAAISMLCHLHLVSLSAPYLGVCLLA